MKKCCFAVSQSWAPALVGDTVRPLRARDRPSAVGAAPPAGAAAASAASAAHERGGRCHGTSQSHTSRATVRDRSLLKFARRRMCDAAVGAGAKLHADGTPRSPYGDPPVDGPRWVANAIYYPVGFGQHPPITMVIRAHHVRGVHGRHLTFNHLIKAPVLVAHARDLPAGRALGLVATEEEAVAARRRRRQEGGVILPA